MKKLLFAAMMMLFATAAYAQKDVTKFLGIPVDGTKAEMIQKLKAKGFTSTAYDPEILEGEFNGTAVHVHVVTNNNKVYRIMVADKTMRDETDIRIRFNRLCRQFNNNPKYLGLYDDQLIPEDEDISYEIAVKDKQYEAVFLQEFNVTDTLAIGMQVAEVLSARYPENIIKTMSQEEIFEASRQAAFEVMMRKNVWFTISDLYGEYYITMYYDNDYNKSNGEDL